VSTITCPLHDGKYGRNNVVHFCCRCR